MWPFQRNRSHRIRSSGPYWLLRNGMGDAAPALAQSIECDIAVIGSGITGALITDALVATGQKHRDAGYARPGAGQHGRQHGPAAVRNRHAPDGSRRSRLAPERCRPRVSRLRGQLRNAGAALSRIAAAGRLPAAREPVPGGGRVARCRRCAPSSRPAGSSALPASGSRARSCSAASVAAGPAASSRRWLPKSIRCDSRRR